MLFSSIVLSTKWAEKYRILNIYPDFTDEEIDAWHIQKQVVSDCIDISVFFLLLLS